MVDKVKKYIALIILFFLFKLPAATAATVSTGEIGADGVWSTAPLFLYNTSGIDYVTVTSPACFKPNTTFTLWYSPADKQEVILKEGLPFGNIGYSGNYIYGVTFNGENNCGQETSMSLSFGTPTGGTTRNIIIKANPNARFCTIDVQPTLVDFSVLSPRSSDWAGVIKTINITPECSGTEAYTLAISGKNDGKYLATDGNLSFLLSDSGKDIDMSNGSAQLKSNVKEGSKMITISPRSSKATVEPGEYKAVMNLIISPI